MCLAPPTGTGGELVADEPGRLAGRKLPCPARLRHDIRPQGLPEPASAILIVEISPQPARQSPILSGLRPFNAHTLRNRCSFRDFV